MREWNRLALAAAALAAAAFLCARADALDGITVSKGKSPTGSNQVAVAVPGRFKVVVCDGSAVKGSPSDTAVSGFYDLKNDPTEKYNYAATWSGFFSHKLAVEPRREGKTGAFMPGPGTVELLEANAVRAVVKHSWPGRAYGGADAPANPDVTFEQTFTVCAPDRLYQAFAIVGIGEEVKLTDFEFMLHTSHARFAGGKAGKGGIYSIEAPWTWISEEGNGPRRFVLHVAKPGIVKHADGTESRHTMDFLMVLQSATGNYGYRANLWEGYRTAIRLAPADPVITKGRRIEWNALVYANHEIAGLAEAAAYVDEYRNPGTPKCAKGKPVGDGFNPARGCYALDAAGGALDFELDGLRHDPMFEVSGWTGGAPKTIRVNGKPAALGADYLAGGEKGRLLLQYSGTVEGKTRFEIAPDGSAENAGFFSTPAP